MNGFAAKTFSAPEEFTYALTAQTCTACGEGEYQNLEGKTTCYSWQVCDADTQVTDFPGSKTRNRDCKCKVGHSRETQATVLDLTEICDPCDSGEYQDSTGQTSCDPCAAGTYQPNAGQTSCDPAVIGYKVGAEGATSQTACGAGTYQDEEGQSSCKLCTGIESVYHGIGGGGFLKIFHWYFYAVETSNIRCLPFSDCDEESVTIDEEGTSSSDQTCKCATGYYRDPAMSLRGDATKWNYPAINSADGSELAQPGTHDHEGEFCTAAEAGYKVSAWGATSPTACGAGTYQNSAGQTSCKSCEDETYQPDEAQTSCSPWTTCADTLAFFASGSSVQDVQCQCAEGHYHGDGATGLASEDSCAQCAAGTYQGAEGAAACESADVGHYATGAGGTTQEPCAAGSFQAERGATTCEACAGGTFAADSGAVRCLPHASCASDSTVGYTTGTATADATCQCAVGHWRAIEDGGGVGLPGYATQFFETTDYLSSFSYTLQRGWCSPAAAGYYVDTEGASAPTQCAGGTYQGAEGAAACESADVGHYVTGAGGTAQEPCAAGSFQAEPGATACGACVGGTFAAVAGSVRCLPHATCTSASTQADNVPTAATDRTCECVEGYWRAAGGTGLLGSAGEFFAGTDFLDWYRYELRAVECTAAPAGSFVSAPGSEGATPCPEGQFQPEVGQPLCLHCEPGSYAPDPGHVRCSSCEPGKFQYLGGQPDCLYCRGYGDLGAPDADYAVSYPIVNITPNAVTYFPGSSQCYACPANAVAETESTHPVDHQYPDKQDGLVGHTYCMCSLGAFADADTLNASRWSEMYNETVDQMSGLRCHLCDYNSYQDTPGNLTTCTSCPTQACVNSPTEDGQGSGSGTSVY